MNKGLTIGVEIEMTGISRSAAAGVLARFFGTRKERIRDYYDTYEVQARDGRIWKVMYDGSLTRQKKVDGELVDAESTYSTELVTPVLDYDDMETLQEVVRALRKRGAFVNESCGLHVHIGADKFKPQNIRTLLNLVAGKEELIYRALTIPAWRKNYYCKKIDRDFLDSLNREKPKTMDGLADIWYRKYAGSRSAHYHQSRYHGINIHATFTKGTIEFRLFNSTLHAGKVKAYIQFCMALVSKALEQKTASPRQAATDNPKYTFRCFLLRLGLIGDEFKTCRHHLLENLPGDSAFRYGRAA